MAKCQPGCTCNRHKKCAEDCTCGRHRNWRERGHQVGYPGRHARVYLERGKASDQICVQCGNQAKEWAQITGTTGDDPSHYQAMCVRCHRHYDDIPTKISTIQRGRKLSDETRAKMSASHKQRLAERPRTPEHQRKLSDALRGQKKSAETKEKMRRSALARHAREREARARNLEQ